MVMTLLSTLRPIPTDKPGSGGVTSWGQGLTYGFPPWRVNGPDSLSASQGSPFSAE